MKTFFTLFLIHAIGIFSVFSKAHSLVSEFKSERELREVSAMRMPLMLYQNHLNTPFEDYLSKHSKGYAKGLFNEILLECKGRIFSSVEVRAAYGIAYGECGSGLISFIFNSAKKNASSSQYLTLNQNEEQKKLLRDYLHFLTTTFKQEKGGNISEYISHLQRIQLSITAQNLSEFNLLSKDYMEIAQQISAEQKRKINSFFEEKGIRQFFQEDEIMEN